MTDIKKPDTKLKEFRKTLFKEIEKINNKTLILLGGTTLEPLVLMTKTLKPKRIFYITSDTEKTNSILDDFKKEVNKILKPEIITYKLNEPLFNNVYQTLDDIKDDLSKENTFFDITTGKKTMSVAAAIFASRNDFKMVYTDYTKYINNIPEDPYFSLINIEKNIVLSSSRSHFNNGIYLFHKNGRITVFSDKYNYKRELKIDPELRSSIRTFEKHRLLNDKYDLHCSVIDNAFNFKEYEHIFKTPFILYIDIDLINIPFEIMPYFKKMVGLKILGNTNKPYMKKDKMAMILFDGNESRKEAEAIRIHFDKNNYEMFFYDSNYANINQVMSELNKVKYFHYAGHHGDRGIKIGKEYLNGLHFKSLNDPPSMVFINGCRALAGKLLQGIVHSKIKYALGPLFDIPYNVEIDKILKLYQDIENKPDPIEKINDFVTELRKKDLYYRVYYG